MTANRNLPGDKDARKDRDAMSMDDGRTSRMEFARRGFLRALGAAAASSLLPGIAAGREPTGATTLLGDFEGGLDGWRTNGGNDIGRIHKSGVPGTLVNGEFGLGVQVHGDPYPMVENKRRVSRADFAAEPYLLADIITTVRDSDAELVVQFRYHHSDGDSGEQSSGADSSHQEKPALVEESPEMSVTQAVASQLYWDMSDLSNEVLSSPERLEIVWYSADQKPDGGPRGRGSSAGVEGLTVLDNVRLTDAPHVAAQTGVRNTVRDLRLEHGHIDDVVTTQRSDTAESGYILFADGTQISYEFEVLSDDVYRYVIDGETFRQGGDS